MQLNVFIIILAGKDNIVRLEPRIRSNSKFLNFEFDFIFIVGQIKIKLDQ